MTKKSIKVGNITKQLDSQNISYEFLTELELDDINLKWKNKFIGNKTAPHLEYFRWHIFSFQKTNMLEGDAAISEYKKQYPTEIFIFNERLQYGIKCINCDKIPNIEMEDVYDDVYICHHNMKWTFVITHESPEIGPYFSS